MWKLVTPMTYGYTILAAEGGGAQSPGCAIPDPRSAPGNASSGMKHPSIGGLFRGDNLGCRS